MRIRFAIEKSPDMLETVLTSNPDFEPSILAKDLLWKTRKSFSILAEKKRYGFPSIEKFQTDKWIFRGTICLEIIIFIAAIIQDEFRINITILLAFPALIYLNYIVAKYLVKKNIAEFSKFINSKALSSCKAEMYAQSSLCYKSTDDIKNMAATLADEGLTVNLNIGKRTGDSYFENRKFHENERFHKRAALQKSIHTLRIPDFTGIILLYVFAILKSLLYLYSEHLPIPILEFSILFLILIIPFGHLFSTAYYWNAKEYFSLAREEFLIYQQTMSQISINCDYSSRIREHVFHLPLILGLEIPSFRSKHRNISIAAGEIVIDHESSIPYRLVQINTRGLVTDKMIRSFIQNVMDEKGGRKRKIRDDRRQWLENFLQCCFAELILEDYCYDKKRSTPSCFLAPGL
jgi:hypothetical protein